MAETVFFHGSESGDFDEISGVQREGAVDGEGVCSGDLLGNQGAIVIFVEQIILTFTPLSAFVNINRVLFAVAAVEGGIVIAGVRKNAECFIVIKIGASAHTRVCRAVIDGLSIGFATKIFRKIQRKMIGTSSSKHAIKMRRSIDKRVKISYNNTVNGTVC